MDHASNSASADFVVLSEAHPGCLSPTDPEARGRRRRRDPIPVYTTLHRPSVESSTLRGRGRYRSPSCVNLIPLSASRAGSPRARHHHQEAILAAAEDASNRRILSMMLLRPENHRRSQSPSRSRSPVLEKNPAAKKKAAAQGMFSSSSMAARRRQRTQSRSRTHGQAGLFETGVLMEGSSLRLELMMAADGSTRGRG